MPFHKNNVVIYNYLLVRLERKYVNAHIQQDERMLYAAYIYAVSRLTSAQTEIVQQGISTSPFDRILLDSRQPFAQSKVVGPSSFLGCYNALSKNWLIALSYI